MLVACAKVAPGEGETSSTTSSTGASSTDTLSADTSSAATSATGTAATGTTATETSSSGDPSTATSSGSHGETEGIPCDPHSDDSCPPGDKCSAPSEPVIWAGKLSCFPVHGDRKKGESCDLGPGSPYPDGNDDCEKGTVCVTGNLLGKTHPICVGFCTPPYWGETTNQSCADPSEFCYSPFCADCLLGICAPLCDPLGGGCPTGTNCVYSESKADPGFLCSFPFGALPGAGEPCDSMCAQGSYCLPSGWVASNEACVDSERCCASLCDITQGNPCPGSGEGESCHQFHDYKLGMNFDLETDPWFSLYENLGICAL